MTTSVQSVAKAAAILTVFDHRNRLLTVREIASKTGIPRSTVQDICATLVESRLLERRPGGGLQLGMVIAMLGGQVIEQQGLLDAVQRPIDRHLARFGVEVHVAEYIPGAIWYALVTRGSGRLVSGNRMGRRWEITASGCGRAVLASMSPAARELELPPTFGDDDRARLDAECLGYERNGYLITRVSQRGYLSIASPVFGSNGLAVGAIGVGEPAEMMSRQRIAALGDAIKSTAADTSRAIGYTGVR